MTRDRSDYNRTYYLRNREKTIAATKAWREADPERAALMARNTHLKSKYGITVEDYDRMAEAQGHVCAICGGPPGTMSLHVDHCHKTGKVRGLLCFKCNGALHYLENVEWREKAEKFLRETS